MINLTKDQIILLQKQLIESFGGIHGIRDDGLLESALAAPYQSFAGTEFYPGIVDKAVRLGFGLIKNHPFLDGNKRIGTHAMLILLDLNGIHLEYDDDELIQIIQEVAAGVLSQESFHLWVSEKIAKE